MRRTSTVYADTSVFGGVFDEEFSRPSRTFFDSVRTGRFSLVVSELVRKEMLGAPPVVEQVWREMLPLADVAAITEEALNLQEAYLRAKILTPRSAEDALHVALATVHGCRMIVSWNFRHIVHFEKIEGFNAVNTLEGYDHIAIYSPLEVICYGSDEEEI